MTRSTLLGSALRMTSGNFLEMFDFFLFGLFAPYIAKAFFPMESEFASLMVTFMTFGAGFLMRPLGAIVLGAYIDRVGRRKGLIATFAIMAVGTVVLALCPTYETIGLLAPVIVLIGRLLQGFSAGVEVGGVSVYLAELAPPGQRGFYVAWQPASQQLAIVAAALIGYVVSRSFAQEQIVAWAWRIPFLLGCLIVPFVLMLRRSLPETAEFAARRSIPSFKNIIVQTARDWPNVLSGMMLVMMATVSFYLLTVYTPTFGKKVLNLSEADSLIATVAVGISNLIWIPLMGAASDRLGRKKLLITFSALTIVTAYPTLYWLSLAPSFERLLMVLLWLSFLYGSYNGAMVVSLTEIVPAAQRTIGFSLAYSLATALFGGFTPAISTALIEVLHDRAAPGIWVSLAAACSLIMVLLSRKRLK